MYLEIKHTQHDRNPLIRSLTAYSEDGQHMGYLDYVLSESEPISLEEMKVVIPRCGIGKALLKEFVRLIGPDRAITAIITHKDTLSYFKSLGLSEKTQGSQIDITEQKCLDSVPIVQFLRSGGISTRSLSLSSTENPKYQIALNGITHL